MHSNQIDVLRFEDGTPIDKHWVHDSVWWRGVILRGRFAHYCWEWDQLPVDETTPEFDGCTCFSNALSS